VKNLSSRSKTVIIKQKISIDHRVIMLIVVLLLSSLSVGLSWTSPGAAVWTKRSRTSSPLAAAKTSLEWDDDLSQIANRYLQGKYGDCEASGDNCVTERNRDEVSALLKEVLPPVSESELKEEVDKLMDSFKGEANIELSAFVDQIKNNKYWVDAGELVVKELMYLDCLQSNYGSQKALLNDDDYDELKDSLTWDGSALVTLSGKEAQFLHAVACGRKGISAIPDSEYQALKADLQAQDSWVVKRAQDPLEKLGMNTLVGYIHRSFA